MGLSETATVRGHGETTEISARYLGKFFSEFTLGHVGTARVNYVHDLYNIDHKSILDHKNLRCTLPRAWIRTKKAALLLLLLLTNCLRWSRLFLMNLRVLIVTGLLMVNTAAPTRPVAKD